MKQRQKGFTLIEIAIVLVIIGLILGGVLKGQEMITNSKTKNVVKDMDGISAAVNTYIDRYRRLPGDDGVLATLQARGAGWATITAAGNNNGVLAITAAQTFTGAGGEPLAFWQHLKAAGLIIGNVPDTGAAALPRNAFGGLVGVTAVGVTGMIGNVVCMSQIPGKGAMAVDVQLDDGIPNSGAVRATTAVVGQNTTPAAAAAAYSEAAVYSVCRNL